MYDYFCCEFRLFEIESKLLYTMIVTTQLNDLTYHAYHGLYDLEKVWGGKFVVNVFFETEVPDGFEPKDLDEVIDYEKAKNIVSKCMSIREDLIETVASKILTQLQQDFTKAIRIEVSICKYNPGWMFHSGSAIVTLSYKK
jgi:dihydroneopterin aldolase